MYKLKNNKIPRQLKIDTSKCSVMMSDLAVC